MKTKKIIVFGANGMLGRYVTQYFKLKNYDVAPITRTNLDLAGNRVEESVFRLIMNYNADQLIVINCAGIIKQRKGADMFSMLRVNSEFPHILDYLSKMHPRIKNIQISTDCVFSGMDGEYLEDSIPDPVDDYGRTKLMGENPNSCIIRTSIIGEEIFNKLSFLEWAKASKGKKVIGFENHYWNGVTCLQLAKYLEDKIRKNHLHKGVRHYFTTDSEFDYDFISKRHLLQLISDEYDLKLKIELEKDSETVDRILITNYKTNPTPLFKQQIKELKEFGSILKYGWND